MNLPGKFELYKSNNSSHDNTISFFIFILITYVIRLHPEDIKTCFQKDLINNIHNYTLIFSGADDGSGYGVSQLAGFSSLIRVAHAHYRSGTDMTKLQLL